MNTISEHPAYGPAFVPGEDDVAGRFEGVLVAELAEPEERLAVTGDAVAAVRAVAAYEAYMTEETWPVSLTSPDLDPDEIANYVQARHVTFHRLPGDHYGWIVQPAAPDTPNAVAVTWLDTSSLRDAALAGQGRPVPLTPHREQTIRNRFADGRLTDAALGKHARRDVPTLLAEIGQLRAQTSDSRAIEDALDDACQELEEQLAAANGRARAAQTRIAELEETLRQVWHVLTAPPATAPGLSPASHMATKPLPASAEDGEQQ